MKKIFFTAVLIGLKLAATAQVTLQAAIPTVGLIQKNQLWNVLLVNSSNIAYNDCRLTIVLRDRLSGQEIFTATSTLFNITRGAKQLNVNTLNPVQYNYLSGTANNNLQGFIPAGSYTICYSLIGFAIKDIGLAEECIPFDAEPLSPPLLIFPADSAVLENAPAQFTWMPPTPAAMFNRLQYDILITEIPQGQKADEAIQQNLPFYNEGSLGTNFLNYPGTVSTFEKNKWYAWQVVARDERAYAGKSEVWVFKIKDSAIEKIVQQAPYIKLSTKSGEVTTQYGEILKIEYYNFLSDSTAMVTIKNLADKSNKHNLSFEIPIKSGQNFLDYNIGKKMKLEEAGIYEVVLTNSRGERHTMTFKYQKN